MSDSPPGPSGGRLFVGIDLDYAGRAILAQMLTDVGTIPGRVVPRENWHLTLRFLGGVDEVTADRLLAALDQEDWPAPFDLRLSGLGAFPNPRRATVLWVGVPGEQIDMLARHVEDAVSSCGFPPEDRPFRPHLTLSRIRPPERVTDLVDHPFGPLDVPVAHVTLFRSHLGGAGAHYQRLESFPLS